MKPLALIFATLFISGCASASPQPPSQRIESVAYTYTLEYPSGPWVVMPEFILPQVPRYWSYYLAIADSGNVCIVGNIDNFPTLQPGDKLKCAWFTPKEAKRRMWVDDNTEIVKSQILRTNSLVTWALLP